MDQEVERKSRAWHTQPDTAERSCEVVAWARTVVPVSWALAEHFPVIFGNTSRAISLPHTVSINKNYYFNIQLGNYHTFNFATSHVFSKGSAGMADIAHFVHSVSS